MTRPKATVVHVITRLIVGGAQLSVVALCEGLREHYDVRLLCGAEEGREGSLKARAAEIVPLTIVPPLRRSVDLRQDVAAALSLRREFRQLMPAIVHTHSSKAGILGRFAARDRYASIVHTIHGWGHTPADSYLRRAAFIQAERVAARWTDAFVAVSPEVRDEGLRLAIGEPRLYEVISELVDYRRQNADFDESRRCARRTLGLDERDEVIGWVGRFVPQKDPDTLVRALELILSARRTARAVLVGDGPMREHAATRLQRSAVGERVAFVGLRSDVRSLYAGFDVLLHPSRWEGQPRVVQEAIAERVPVVAAGVAGTRSIVAEGRAGFLTEPGDDEGMAARAITILEGSSLRAPLAEDVVAEVAAAHGQEVALRRHLELYERLLAARDTG
jgi:glycosyltransferase involved in cell wall biosynthesis